MAVRRESAGDRILTLRSLFILLAGVGAIILGLVAVSTKDVSYAGWGLVSAGAGLVAAVIFP